MHIKSLKKSEKFLCYFPLIFYFYNKTAGFGEANKTENSLNKFECLDVMRGAVKCKCLFYNPNPSYLHVKKEKKGEWWVLLLLLLIKCTQRILEIRLVRFRFQLGRGRSRG